MPRDAQRDPKALKATTTGLALVDALSVNTKPTIGDYLSAVSEYVINVRTLPEGGPKQAQIALGSGLGRVLATELAAKVRRMKLHAGELKVAGALRDARADVSEAHELDGLRLAVELKPVNLAVGRALWNRFGDIRAFAVNIHLKFPFAVVGGVLAIPTWEEAKITKRMAAERSAAEAALRQSLADQIGDDGESGSADEDEDVREEEAAEALQAAGDEVYRKPTTDLIKRLIQRLDRTRLRETKPTRRTCLKPSPSLSTTRTQQTFTQTCQHPVPGYAGISSCRGWLRFTTHALTYRPVAVPDEVTSK